MNHSWIISRYIARQFLFWLLVFLAALVSIIFLFETAELLRRATGKAGATFGIVMQMSFYKLPETVDKTLPFVILFAALYTFWRLTRSQELVVVRAAGVSVWQFLMPVLATTVIFSTINVGIFNTIGASMVTRYRALETTYLLRQTTMQLTGAGLWMRQNVDDREYLIHADRVELQPLKLMPLMAIVYSSDGHYVGRIDAKDAVLQDGYWQVNQAWFNAPGTAAEYLESFQLATDITYEKIQESMAAPNTVSFWELPAFIHALQAVGLPTLRHQLQLHSLLAQPWLLCAMAFFAAAFALRLTRQGGILPLAASGIAVGTLIFTLNNILMALGTTQTLPVLLSAWTTPIMSIMLGVAALLYLEDG
jgi:lipopolysaccharide export system permease protein